jgi:hypothetical protein
MSLFGPSKTRVLSENDNVKSLIRALGRQGVGHQAAEALGKSRDARAVLPLIKTFQDSIEREYTRQKSAKAHYRYEKEITFREKAAEALGKLGDIRAVDPLIRALKTNEMDLFKISAKALGRLGDPRAISPLLEVVGRKWPPRNVFSKSDYIYPDEPVVALFKLVAIEPLCKILKNPETPSEIVSQIAAPFKWTALNPENRAFAREAIIMAIQNSCTRYPYYEDVVNASVVLVEAIFCILNSDKIDRDMAILEAFKSGSDLKRICATKIPELGNILNIMPVIEKKAGVREGLIRKIVSIPNWEFYSEESSNSLAAENGTARFGSASVQALRWSGKTKEPSAPRISGILTCAYCGSPIPFDLAGVGANCEPRCQDSHCSRYDLFLDRPASGEREIIFIVASVVSHLAGTPILPPKLEISSIFGQD